TIKLYRYLNELLDTNLTDSHPFNSLEVTHFHQQAQRLVLLLFVQISS
ncbi:MAG: hypothetical protein ACI9RM_001836, partial [Ulvibacter sp.]